MFKSTKLMVSYLDSKVFSIVILGSVKKFSKLVLLHKNDIVFIGSAIISGFILQRICQEYLCNQKKIKDSKNKY